jgi:hypothetical protein
VPTLADSVPLIVLAGNALRAALARGEREPEKRDQNRDQDQAIDIIRFSNAETAKITAK